MRVFEALNQMRNQLPLERTGSSYIETLQYEFSEYISLLNDIDEVDFNALLRNEGSPIIIDLTKRKFISFIKKVQQTISSIISIYYEGYPDEAYKLLENLLMRNKFAPSRSSVRCAYANNYLNDQLGNFFLLEWREELINLYRMRISKETLSKEKMFHVPFNMREKVSSARFSIPGFPCLYLGTSLEVCWNEIKRSLESEEQVFACRVENHKLLSLINLVIPDECLETIIETDAHFAFSFLSNYPFYLSCLMKVAHPDEPFKPEYIISQLLLQYIKKQDMLDGIIYSSTKDHALVGVTYCNIVIPAREMAAEGYCRKAKTYYHITEPILIDLENINEGEENLNISLATRLT